MGTEAALEEAPPVLKRAVATLRVGAGGTATASEFWSETTAMTPESAPAPPSLGRGGEANSVEVPLMSREVCSASSGPAITARGVEESVRLITWICPSKRVKSAARLEGRRQRAKIGRGGAHADSRPFFQR